MEENKGKAIVLKFVGILGAIGGFIGFCFGKAWIDTYGMPKWLMWLIVGILAVLGVVYFINKCKKEAEEDERYNVQIKEEEKGE